MTNDTYDVVVIGGGHAGAEAATAAARMGAKTALVTHKIETLGEMSCNPAFGGIGKGTLVREIDAMDGVMARCVDQAGIHFRMLNASRGPAVHGPRAQADRALYRQAMQAVLLAYPNLTIVADEAVAFDIANPAGGNVLQGVLLASGARLRCGAAVLTTGTFLRGLIHIGEKKIPAGRVDEAPSLGLSGDLERAGVVLGRLKTGTPARLDANTIDWSSLEPQPGDNPPVPFSELTARVTVPQTHCYITYTSPQTHEIIRANLHRAPMYSGQIEGVGPRYCPSIEDKVVRFADKERHQIFLEPEGLDDPTVYPNGISTSLPEDVQDAMIRSIAGLERVAIKRYGYAIEYDYVDPRQLHRTLELKAIRNLYLAGQINGTTGYEEAGGQGVMAGANAALRAAGTEPFILDRSDGYIGVMIDDLVTFGVTEPYRMFTSRSEYRLTIRADNADQRLTDKAMAIGLIGSDRQSYHSGKMDALSVSRETVLSLSLTPQEAAQYGVRFNLDGQRRTGMDLLAHLGYEEGWQLLSRVWPDACGSIEPKIRQQLWVQALYKGYLQRQDDEIRAFKREESAPIPVGMVYRDLPGVSRELLDKLEKHRPETLGAASRIPGMTPAALSALMAHIHRHHQAKVS